MRIFVLFYLLFTIHSSISAQQDIVAIATDLIVSGKYDAADHYLDSLLTKDKKNVDVMMMKGNVILNRELGKIPDITLKANADESPFTSDAGELSESVKIVPLETAKEIEAWWKKCLRADNRRMDIHQGLCTLYAMALLKEDLKKQLPELLKIEKDSTGEQAYKLAEYARKFKERGQFDMAIEIYEFIAAQFPQLAGIRCDIGSEFFYEGKMKDALRYLDSAMAKKQIDESSYLNAAFIYSELGYFDNAYKCFADYSATYNARMDVFYKGLMLFSNSDSRYADTLNYFIVSTDSNAYYPEYLLANELLSVQDTFRFEDYERILSGEHSEWYLPLIYQRAMRQFADTCKPFIDYGIFQNRIKNYPAAVQFLEEGERCNMSSERKENWMLRYAYALYQCGLKEKALLYFNPVTFSENNFRQQAAKYFAAKLLIENGRPGEAIKLLEDIIAANEPTKYKALAQLALKRIN